MWEKAELNGLKAFGGLEFLIGVLSIGQILKGQLSEGVSVAFLYLIALAVEDTEASAGQVDFLVLVLLDDFEIAADQLVFNSSALGLHQIRLQPKPRFAAAGTADDQHVFVPSSLGIGRAVVHGEHFRLGGSMIVLSVGCRPFLPPAISSKKDSIN